MFALIFSLLLATHAHAVTFEADPALVREAYQTVGIGEAAIIEDPGEDYAIIDRQQRGKATPILADLRSVAIVQGSGGWIARFAIERALPADPGMPVNFHVYVDRPDVANAPAGASWAESDMMLLLLFGTRTKWHAESWTYARAGGWTEQTLQPAFTVGDKEFTMTIPYSLVPRESRATVRFLSLVDNNAGITMIDVAPGTHLPAAALPPRERGTALPAIVFGILTICIVGGVFLRRRNS